MPEGRRARGAGTTPRTRPVVPPIHHSVTYFLDDDAYKDIQAGGLDEIWYGRFRNPTVDLTADLIADLESAEAGFMTSSGMGAISTTLLTLLSSGDRIVAANQVYGDTRDLLVRDLPAWGFHVQQVDAVDLDAWREAVAAGPTTVMYVESMTNPQLELADLPALARIARDHGARLVVDNTFATPYCLQPLTHGADLVVHSATKFLNGHSDVIAGVVVGPYDILREVQRRVITLGTCLDPHAAYLVWRGLQTFDLRISRSNETAAAVAKALTGHRDVIEVRHASLPGSTQAEVASRLLRRDADGSLRAGAMVAFTVAGGDDRALQLMRRLRVACEATSLGGVETLISAPFNSSHFSLSAQERRDARIGDGMLRLSCGVEPAAEIIADLFHALDATSIQGGG